VNEYVASAIVGLDEAVTAFCIEELNCSIHGHRENSPLRRYAPLRIGPTGPSLPEDGHGLRIRLYRRSVLKKFRA
jgi:hypothetical protein